MRLFWGLPGLLLISVIAFCRLYLILFAAGAALPLAPFFAISNLIVGENRWPLLVSHPLIESQWALIKTSYSDWALMHGVVGKA